MREIKFRAWSKKEKMMAYDIQKEYDTIADVRYWKDGVKTDKEPFQSSFGSYLGSDEFIVIQFTGLKDKNGKDIYEGDILLEETPRSLPFVIKWEQEQWVEDGFVSGFTCLRTGSNCYAVIGNIYENPELL